jgi:hypothetical protein
LRKLLTFLVVRMCRHRLIADRVDKSTPYLSRWYLFGNATSPWFAAVHQIHKSDADGHVHSHPFNYVALQLRGLMYEEQLDGVHKRRPGYFRIRRRSSVHRLDLPRGEVWSLFLGFGRRGSWGFLVNGKIVNHAEYLS